MSFHTPTRLCRLFPMHYRLFILLAGFVLAGKSFALPPCPTTNFRHNCFGSYTTPSGNKYVGEFQG